MKVLFVAGFGPIITDIDKSRDLYVSALGLPLTEDPNHYFYTEDLKGIRHFALWPLSQAAESCFGTNIWPDNLPTPTSWMEFDVDNIEAATRELEDAGYTLLVSAQKEPWGQTVTRMLTPEGILLGVTYTPSMRETNSS